jgi:hypothetical protein
MISFCQIVCVVLSIIIAQRSCQKTVFALPKGCQSFKWHNPLCWFIRKVAKYFDRLKKVSLYRIKNLNLNFTLIPIIKNSK